MSRIIRKGESAELQLPGRRSSEVIAARTGSKALTVRIVEMDPGPADRGPHVHDGFEEVIHVLEGTGLLLTDSGRHELTAGDTVLVPSGERHATCNTGSTPLRLYCVFPINDIRPGTREFAGWDKDPDA